MMGRRVGVLKMEVVQDSPEISTRMSRVLMIIDQGSLSGYGLIPCGEKQYHRELLAEL